VAENQKKVNEFYKAAMSAGPRTTFRPAHDWNTTRDTTPLMSSTQTDIHSRSSMKA